MRSNQEAIILMPFSALSVLAFHELKRQHCNIVGFFDNAERLNDKSYCGVPILTPRQATDELRLVVFCEAKYSKENREQLEAFAYQNFAMIEDIVEFANTRLAIEDVDVKTFFKLAPASLNFMKDLMNRFCEPYPDCLLTKGDFAVIAAPISLSERACDPYSCVYNDDSEFNGLKEYLSSKKNTVNSIVAFFAPYPFNAINIDGYHKAILATDEMFSDNNIRVYFEPDYDVYLCSGVKIRKIADKLIYIRYSPNNEKHIREIHSLLKCCDIIYIHSIYHFEEELLKYADMPIVLDIHGVVPEENEYKGTSQDIVEALFQKEAMAFNLCNLFLCRNESMMDHYESRYGTPREKMVKLPSISELSLPVSEHLDSRIDLDDRVSIIYSGGIDKWQMVPMMLEGISQRPEYLYVIATAEVNTFVELVKPLSFHDIEVLYVEPDLLEKVYSRARYGFALREDMIINRVACPTKLVEYCAFGLVPIMLSNRIGDFDRYGLKFVHFDDFCKGRLPDEDIRREMAEHNFSIAQKMAVEYEECKKELQKAIISIADGCIK